MLKDEAMESEEVEEEVAGMRNDSGRWWLPAAVILLLVVAASLRLYGIRWDATHHLHPDERWIVMVTTDMSWPRDLLEALDPRSSPFNPYYDASEGMPRSFAYGSFPLYLLRLVSVGVSRLPLGRDGLAMAANYSDLPLVGRPLSALFDLGTVFLVFLVGRRAYGRSVGLLAAALAAFAVIQIQLSHFYATDTVATFFIMATIYFGLGIARRADHTSAILGGLCWALAVASKFSALPVGAVLAVAYGWALWRWSPGGSTAAWEGEGVRSPESRQEHTNQVIYFAVLTAIVAATAFALVSPYSLLDFDGFARSIGEQGEMVRGIRDYPYTRQYAGTIPYLYHIQQQVLWGVGPLAGVVAFGGLIWATIRAIRRKRREDWVLLAWAIPYFAITGGFYVKFMRYMLPLMPVLYILGSEMLLQLGAWLRRRVGVTRWARMAPLWYALIGLVVVSTALWALAFVRIYTSPHTRVTASEWIYNNVPTGSILAIEHWDDALPLGLRVDGQLRTISEYETVTMALYEPDNAVKFQHIVDNLRRADYVILSSNRLYGSIPRLPDRYPLTTRYYDALFAGELGFRLEKQFSSYPGWGDIRIGDDHADESFTVYDHPKVLIYGKVRDLSDPEFRSVLGSGGLVSPESPPVEGSGEGRSLMLDGPVEDLPAADDFRWNHWASGSTWMAIFTWWLALEAIGLLVLPLCYVILSPLRDRGYAFAKTMGLLLIAYLTWLPASLSLLPNRLSTIAAGAILLAALSTVAFLWKRRQMVAFWRSRLWWIGFVELAFTLSFVAFVGVRVLNPDLWQPWLGGEKPMEFAFLNAVLKSPYFPPYDPYFAGGYINYYYYGYFVIAILIKITGTVPSVAFNLAIPSLFALTIVNALCMGRMLGRSWAAGVSAAVAVGVLGNLGGGMQFVEWFGKLGGLPFRSAIPGLEGLVRMFPGLFRWGIEGFPPIAFDYWRSTRLIPFAINEFPFFSFLFADLHPHMMGLPFTILCLGLIWCVLRRTSELWDRVGGARVLWRWRFAWRDLGLAALLALTLGALATINTWDLPTYLGLVGLVLLMGLLRGGWEWHLLWPVPGAAVLAMASLLLYWPFFANYQALYVGIGRVEARTDFEPFAVIWGLFIFLISSYLLNKLLTDRARDPASRFLRLVLRRWERLPHLVQLHRALVGGDGNAHRWWLTGLAVGGLVLVALLVVQQWMLAWIFALLAMTALLLSRRGLPDEERFLLLLLLAGEAILLGCELIYMKDFLDGSEYRRMNTIFKFYIQVWVLWGIGAGALLPRLWSRVVRWRAARWRAAWTAILAILLGASLIYPIWGTRARVADRFPGARPPIGTLDGMDFMRVGSYTWPDESNRIELRYDYEAIRWLLDNVPGTPVVAEAALPYYREGGMRVASYTGLPGLLGAHQSEQRYSWMTGERDGQVRQLFDGGDVEAALRVIRDLRIRYIYVGQLERTVYDARGLAKFDKWLQEGRLEVAFQNEGVTLYRVLSDT